MTNTTTTTTTINVTDAMMEKIYKVLASAVTNDQQYPGWSMEILGILGFDKDALWKDAMHWRATH